MPVDLQKRKPYRNKKIRDAARGEDCTMESPFCNYDSVTTVFCHLNESYAGKGISQKADDIGFFGCSACHTAYDQKKLHDEHFWVLRAVYRTLRRLLDKGILK